MHRLRITNRAIAIAVFSAVAVFLFLKHQYLLQITGDYLVISDALKPADIIHVIAGENHRTLYGISLYREGYAKRLFFTGGWCELHREYHGAKARRMALQRGLPESAVVADDTSVTTTYAEALRLKSFIRNQPDHIASIIVVSDPHHMRRVRWTYRKIFGDQMEIQLAPVPFNLSPYKRKWWRQPETNRFVIREYIKLSFYYVRYHLSSGRLREWLARLDRY